MKIGLVSDLHIDASPWNKALVPHLVGAVAAAELDVLVVAGDIAAHLVPLSETLNDFQLANLECHKLFVPGNHDIWAIETPDVTSEQKCDIISQICYECGFHPLMEKPFVTEKVAFCGTIGWYDYTFAPDGYDFSEDQYAEKKLMGAVWNDRRYANGAIQIPLLLDTLFGTMSHVSLWSHTMFRFGSVSNTAVSCHGIFLAPSWEAKGLGRNACESRLSHMPSSDIHIKSLIDRFTASGLSMLLSVIFTKDLQLTGRRMPRYKRMLRGV